MMRAFALHEKLLTWEIAAIALGMSLLPIVSLSPVITVNSSAAMATSTPRTCANAPDDLHKQACQLGYVSVAPISRADIPVGKKRLTIAGVVCFASGDSLMCVTARSPRPNQNRNLLTLS